MSSTNESKEEEEKRKGPGKDEEEVERSISSSLWDLGPDPFFVEVDFLIGEVEGTA